MTAPAKTLAAYDAEDWLKLVALTAGAQLLTGLALVIRAGSRGTAPSVPVE